MPLRRRCWRRLQVRARLRSERVARCARAGRVEMEAPKWVALLRAWLQVAKWPVALSKPPHERETQQARVQVAWTLWVVLTMRVARVARVRQLRVVLTRQLRGARQSAPDRRRVWACRIFRRISLRS